MRAIAPALGLAIAAGLIVVAPALAADRSSGAGVPKPTAAGLRWSEADVRSLRTRIDEAFADRAFAGAHAGLLAVDVRGGRVVYARAADDAFQPASALKLLTGSVALDVLGPGYRFRTELVATGVREGGVLRGQLIVRAGGDPFLAAADFDAAASAVAASGITNVDSGVVIDTSHGDEDAFPAGWSVDDLPFGYAAPVSAMTFEHNALHVTVTPAAQAGGRASVTVTPSATVGVPYEGCGTPVLVPIVIPAVVTGAADAADTVTLDRDRAGCVHVHGTIAAGSAPETLDAAVQSPVLFAYQGFVDALRRHGVAVNGLYVVAGPWPDEHRTVLPITPQAVLWSHASEPLADVLADTWLPSDNLAAELLLREIGFVRAGAPGTAANGLAEEARWLAALGVDGRAYDVRDGSGLSVYDRITPRALVAIVQHDWNGPYRDAVLDDLPIAGVRGTLADSYVGTPAERRIFAKSGTLTHVAALAGYVRTARHGAVAFALMVDDATADPAGLRAARGRVLSVLAGG